jgi:hypothetical protein
MDATQLTDEQRERLHTQLDARRRFLERLHARMVEQGFPAVDPLRRQAAVAVRAMRELVLAVNDGRRKGQCRRFQRQAKDWPRV